MSKRSIVLINGKEMGQDIDKNLHKFISEKQEAKCFLFHRPTEKLMWVEPEYTHADFGRIKKLIKNGVLCCREYNNKELIMNDTSKWYSLVLQDPIRELGPDIAGMKIFNFVVDGLCYFFQNKKLRDAMFKWINK